MAHTVAYLRSLPAIRERSLVLYEHALLGNSSHFRLNLDAISAVVERLLALIERDYNSQVSTVPGHSRWRHFEVGGIDRVANLLAQRPHLLQNPLELCRRLLDLVFVSVLLDAGAGTSWKFYETSTGQTFARSEGLAVASWHMFCEGSFSSDSKDPFRVDSVALTGMSLSILERGLQVSETNPLLGLKGRLDLLHRLGSALTSRPEFFSSNSHFRPGGLVDYLVARASPDKAVSVETLWSAIIDGLASIWPADRTSLGGSLLGDVWPHSAVHCSAETGGNLVPFHKLSQWLTYSLFEPLQQYASLNISGQNLMTGLPEYRNGGLLIDMGVLIFVDPHAPTIAHSPTEELIVEWRALTVILLDKISDALRLRLGKTATELPLAKVLEAGTWKLGRIVAKEKRSDGSPPLRIESDGTLF